MSASRSKHFNLTCDHHQSKLMTSVLSASAVDGSTEQTTSQQKLQYNYATISRYDPRLAQIFCTSAICTVYKFDVELGEWDKVNCQGTIFVYSRALKPGDVATENDTQKYPYGLFVLNRLNADNFSLGLCPASVSRRLGGPEMHVSLEDPYIMVQSLDGAMYGLWLFNESDRNPMCDTLKWCLSQEI